MKKYLFSRNLNFTITQKDRVLDVGCGNGRIVRVLEPICEVYGIDINNRKFPEGSRNLFCADICSPEIRKLFRKGYFTKILFTETLEHVENDEMALKNISWLLARGGKLFLTAPAHIRGFDFYDPAWIKWRILHKKPIHRHYTIEELKEKLGRYGLKVTKYEVMGAWWWPIPRWINSIARNFLKINLSLLEPTAKKGFYDI